MWFLHQGNLILVWLPGDASAAYYICLPLEGVGWGSGNPESAARRGLSLPCKAWLLQGARLFGFTQQGECCYGWIASNKSYDLEQQIVYIT